MPSPHLTTTCDACGPVDVGVQRAVLRLTDGSEGGICIVRCPSCGARLEKRANASMVMAMIAVGVAVTQMPASDAGADPLPLAAIDEAELAEFRQVLGHEVDVLRWLQR